VIRITIKIYWFIYFPPKVVRIG